MRPERVIRLILSKEFGQIIIKNKELTPSAQLDRARGMITIKKK